MDGDESEPYPGDDVMEFILFQGECRSDAWGVTPLQSTWELLDDRYVICGSPVR